MPALGDKNVGGFDVAVHDSFAMRSIQGVSDLDPQIHHLFKWQRLAGDAVLQRLAVEKLHRNEGLAAVFTDFMDGANIGMVQGGSSLCFTVEAAQSL